MELALKILALLFIVIGVFFEFFSFSLVPKFELSLRKGDISAYISGTAFAIVGIIVAILLFIIE